MRKPNKRVYKRIVAEREVIVQQVIDKLMEYNDYGKKSIADEAKVHWTTLYFWISGATRNPRITTLIRVAKAMGYDIVLQKTKVKLRSVR